jgi:hypothetical protein
VGIALLVLQSFVRQGRRGATTAAGLVCWLVVLLPLIPVGLASIGHSPDAREMLGIGLLVMIWVALHLRIVLFLRKAKYGL